MMKRAAKGIVPQRKYDPFQDNFNQCILCILRMVIHTFCNVLWYSELWDEKIWMVGERFVWWSKERALPIDWKLHCRMVGYATTHLRARARMKEQFLHTPPPNTTARKIALIFNHFFVTHLPMQQLTLGQRPD